MIGTLSLQENDLDFRYLPEVPRATPPSAAEVRTVVDVSRFFSRAGHHVLMAIDCAGGQGENNPHCGPIIRHGENLFATARGVILLGDGTVMAETWNGTFSPGLQVIENTSGEAFDPAAIGVLSLRVTLGYAAGGVAVEIRSGLVGPVVFSGAIPTSAQAWTGRARACVGGIALGFVPPINTSCVEQLLPRSAPDARVGYAAMVQLVG